MKLHLQCVSKMPMPCVGDEEGLVFLHFVGVTHEAPWVPHGTLVMTVSAADATDYVEGATYTIEPVIVTS